MFVPSGRCPFFNGQRPDVFLARNVAPLPVFDGGENTGSKTTKLPRKTSPVCPT